jgi:uncharacterized protein YecE (DUF72 family)
MKPDPAAAGRIRVGIGGWTFAPWRGPFYPAGLPAARELSYAAGVLSSIEINGTFYRTQSPESFAKWRDETPDDFVFSVKAPRAATWTREPAKAEASVARFLSSGLLRLGGKLGPILWQMPPTRRFDEAFSTFIDLLPASHEGAALRHVVEARHESFNCEEFVALLRARKIARAIIDSGKHALLGDLTGDFVYARLERNDAAAPEGYASASLDAWRDRAARWSKGEPVSDLPCVGPAPAKGARDCFLYFISGDKERAPSAAQAMLARLASAR